MTSRVTSALRVSALVIAVALVVGASFLRTGQRKDPVVEVIELSGAAPSTTTTTEEPASVEVPIEIAPPSVHIDAPPRVESDDDGVVDVVPPSSVDPFEDDDGAEGDDDDGSDGGDDRDDD